MARIEPFRAWRPDLGRVGPLSAAVSVPVPGIAPTGPWSAAHLLGENAGATLREWLRDDILVQDSARSLYVVEQDIPSEAFPFVQRGLLCRVGLEDGGSGGRFAPRLEEGRDPGRWLDLLRATHWNVAPALANFPDDDGTVAALLERATGRALPLETDDPRGGKCRLWAVSDSATVSALCGAVGAQPLEWLTPHLHDAALLYLAERDEPETSPARFVMALLVGATEPGPARAPLAGLAYHSLKGH
ncbi:MAG: DUF1015 family protein [Gemmataceae bacterium]|nr:DUF1015 family protein [Gemmataceae bacterium]